MRRLLAPLGVGAAGVLLLWVVEPSVVRSSASSPRAWGLIAVTVVVSMVLGRLARRGPGGTWLGPVAAALPGVIVIATVLLPSLQDRRLDEDLPGLDPAAAEPSAPAPSLTTAPAGAPAPAPAAPVRLTTGRLRGIDHDASGTVSVFRLANGELVVRFEDVAIEGSPDPVLYLVPRKDAESREGGRRIADLRATHGTFSHPIPSDWTTDGEWSVFIWCGQFAVPIATADQRQV
jgi:hypothetical protein